MNIIAFLDICSLALYTAALAVIIAAIGRRRIPIMVGIFIAICMAIAMFVCASNILEHLKVTDALDDYEGFARDISTLFLILFLYLDSIHRELQRRAWNERQIQNNLEEKTTLLKEIHHRVKNNLQIVSSLLSLQSGAQNDERISDIINIAKNRILSISAVHEIIYSSAAISRLTASDFLNTILSNLAMAYDPKSRNIEIISSLDSDIYLDVDSAVPIGLIVNELISNSLKHAFAGKASGRIEVVLKRKGDAIELRVSDDGTGMAPGSAPDAAAGIGMSLIRGLVVQIHGEMSIDSARGTNVSIVFPDTYGKPEAPSLAPPYD